MDRLQGASAADGHDDVGDEEAGIAAQEGRAEGGENLVGDRVGPVMEDGVEEIDAAV